MIEIPDNHRKAVIESIQRYFLEQLDEEIGELKATLLLDYFLQEIAPSVYNKAIADATTHMQDRVADMEGSVYKPELTYWQMRKQKQQR